MDVKFPRNFKFGVADADLQVIGEDNTRKYEGSEPTMWNYFARSSGKCYKNQTPGTGVDRYHRWKEDIEIMKKMGVKQYRTSISMSRILKKNGEINAKAIAWYTQYFKSLKKAGITIYATLYHWELPQHLNAQGGWTNRKTIEYFEKHSTAVANNLGEFIDEYFILNELWVCTMLGYYQGVHAPGEKSLKKALLAAHNILLAQGLVTKKLLNISPELKVSTSYSVIPAYSASEKKEDMAAASYADGYFNSWFSDPLYLGEYPKHMVELFDKDMPSFSKEDMKTIKVGDRLHALGLNYYRGYIASYNPKERLLFQETKRNKGLTNDLGWPIYLPPNYPEGLYDIINQFYYSYKNFGLKSIYITENGMAQKTPWDGKTKVINDDRRVAYLKEHIKQVHKAIAQGIPVDAYFAWTLMDNYEWAEGYRPESCFGLIHVDRKTMKRVWKKSAYWYKKLMNSNSLPE